MKIQDLKSLSKKIENKKAIIAKQRDGLRELHGELEDLLESFDTGIDSLDLGLADLERGIDTLSEFV